MTDYSAATINTGNALTTDLLVAVGGGRLENIVGGGALTTNGTVTSTANGWTFAANSSITLPDTQLTQYTVFVWAFADGVSGVLVGRTSGAANGYNQNYILQLFNGVTPRGGHKEDFTSNYPTLTSSGSGTDGVLLTAAYTYDGTNQEIYLNGTSTGTQAAAAPWTSSSTGMVTQIGAVDGVDRASYYQGNGIQLVLIFDRALTDAEITSLHGDPDQVFNLSSDTTVPTLTGSITATSKTSTTVALSCPTGSDNVAVTGYEWSSDNGATWPGQTAGVTYTFTGLTALTSYTFRVRAKDAAGNVSTPALTLTTSTYRAGATGQYILDNTGPIGGNPAGILYNDVQVGDEAKWFSFVITTAPATGTLVIDADGTFTFTGPNAETMYYQLEVDGANVGSPVLVELFSGSFFRPLADVTTTGWTSTGATLYAAINELAADDADYITSPDVAGTPGSYTFDLPSMAAGTYTRRMRMKKTGSTGEARLVFLDAGAASVGTTAWIALTASWATYEASVTLTGTAVRGRIEVRA